MSTPFQRYLIEQLKSIKTYDTPPGFIYDPVRDQSVKDPTYVEPEVKPRPPLGPRPDFDWEIDLVNNPYTFVNLLVMLLLNEFKPNILGIDLGPDEFWDNITKRLIDGFLNLPENVEDWQEYFDNLTEEYGGLVGYYIPQIVQLLQDIVENGVEPGEYEILGQTINVPPLTEYVRFYFNQYLQQLIDFLSDYEQGG